MSKCWVASVCLFVYSHKVNSLQWLVASKPPVVSELSYILEMSWWCQKTITNSLFLHLSLSLDMYSGCCTVYHHWSQTLHCVSALDSLPLNCWDWSCVSSLLCARCTEPPDSSLALHPASCASQMKAAVTWISVWSQCQTFIWIFLSVLFFGWHFIFVLGCNLYLIST